jgi:hypothetical protein
MWHTRRPIKERWIEEIHKHAQGRKAMASLAMLRSWKFWKEQNARLFWNRASTANMLVAKIKEEVTMWSLVGTKVLSIVIPRE